MIMPETYKPISLLFTAWTKVIAIAFILLFFPVASHASQYTVEIANCQ